MRKALGRLVLFAVVGAALAQSPAAAQQPPTEPELDYPESPNGYPMEAIWDAAPGTEGGVITQTGPYRVSRWGDIVIRGRPEDGRIVSALSFIQCGKTKNPATQVAIIGEAPDDLCDGVIALEPGRTNVVSGKNYSLYGQSTGWTVIDFAQEVGNASFNNGFLPATAKDEKKLGVNSLGAVFQIQNGKYVFFAPGETVKLTDNVNFVVAPVMEDGEVSTLQVAAVFDRSDSSTKLRRPIGFYVLFFGILPLLIVGIGYRIFSRRRARRATKFDHQMTGALPSNPEDADRSARRMP